jgi:hypothetical protein
MVESSSWSGSSTPGWQGWTETKVKGAWPLAPFNQVSGQVRLLTQSHFSVALTAANYFRMQCFVKSRASFDDQSPFGLAFMLVHHLSLPISGAQAVSVSRSAPARTVAINFLSVFIAGDLRLKMMFVPENGTGSLSISWLRCRAIKR